MHYASTFIASTTGHLFGLLEEIHNSTMILANSGHLYLHYKMFEGNAALNRNVQGDKTGEGGGGRVKGF
jgi:hypothetical protein